MKKATALMVACLSLLIWAGAGWCEEGEGSDSGADMGEAIESAVTSSASEGESELNQINESMDAQSTSQSHVDEIMDSQ